MATDEQSYFLIVSGNRTGSTWLELSLNVLHDVSAAFEMQWTETAPTPFHVAMRSPGFDILRTLDDLREGHRVAGSKLVLPGQVDLDDIENIPNLVPEEVRIVHLSRRYMDSYLSRIRNAGHLRNPAGKGSRHPWLADVVVEETFCETDAIDLDLDDARNNFQRRLAFDEQFSRFDDAQHRYFYVDYETLAACFRDIARHVGSGVQDTEIQSVIDAPPTRKLPPIQYANLVRNFDELVSLGTEFESKRQALLSSHGSV